jgi:hypothetical protein
VIPAIPTPQSLVTFADLTAISLVDQTKTNAQESLVRIENTVAPMPPLPYAPATAADIAALQKWISAGYPKQDCTTLDGGAFDESSDASLGVAPYTGPLICSTGQTYNSGNGPGMRPGEPCSNCHNFTIAGTVYKTEHESSLCNGSDVAGANVVVTDITGAVTTIPVTSEGNFYTTNAIAGPFQAKVVYQGREQVMLEPQATGSCNLCHTPVGANSAPGRIMLP